MDNGTSSGQSTVPDGKVRERKAMLKRRLHAIERTLLFIITGAIVILLTMCSAFADENSTDTSPQISGVVFSGSLEYGSAQVIQASVTDDISLQSVVIVLAAGEYSMQEQSGTFSYSYSPGIGNVSFQITATDSSGQNSTYSSSFTVQDTTAPSVASAYPAASATLASQSFSINATTSESADCKYDTSDVGFSSMSTAMAGSGTFHTRAVTLADGQHSYYVRCADPYNNAMQASYLLNFIVDTTPPVLSGLQPSGTVYTGSALLNATSSEPSTCRYGTVDAAYDSLPSSLVPSASSNSLTHSTSLSGLAQGSYTYHVRCKDTAGNVQQSSSAISFTVNLKPTASIDIDHSSPLPAGTYDITLTASESLSSVPALTYKYDSESATRSVSLAGSGTSFSGSIVIEEGAGNKVASFSFSGTDVSGVAGNEIASGGVFIADTVKPIAPSSVSAASTDEGNIRLRWFYEGESADGFRIYRVEGSAQPEYVDFYTEGKGDSLSSFTDSNVEQGRAYTYSVAAVDKAGNVGALSQPTQAIAKMSGSAPLPQEVQDARKDAARKTESYLFDADASLTRINKITAEDELAILRAWNAQKKIEDARQGLQEIIEQLNELEGNMQVGGEGKTSFQLTEEIALLVKKAELFKSQLPKRVDMESKVTSIEPFSHDALSEAISEVVDPKMLKEVDFAKYTAQLREIQDKISVSTTILSGRIVLDKGSVPIIVVRKKVTTSEPLNDVSLVEVIPKEFVDDVAKIRFDSPPHILRQDPIVSWDRNLLVSSEIEYYVESDDAFNAKSTRLVVIRQPDPRMDSLLAEGQDFGSSQSSITGLVTGLGISGDLASGNGVWLWIGVVIIGGLLVYYFFFLDSGQGGQSVPAAPGFILPAQYAFQYPSNQYASNQNQNVASVSASMPRSAVSGINTNKPIVYWNKQATRKKQEKQSHAAIDSLAKRALHAAYSGDKQSAYRHYVALLGIFNSGKPIRSSAFKSREEVARHLDSMYSMLRLHEISEAGHSAIDRGAREDARMAAASLSYMWEAVQAEIGQKGFSNSQLSKNVIKNIDYFNYYLKNK